MKDLNRKKPMRALLTKRVPTLRKEVNIAMKRVPTRRNQANVSMRMAVRMSSWRSGLAHARILHGLVLVPGLRACPPCSCLFP